MPRDLTRKPPWEAFPQIEWGSIGWRMGPGEDYWHEWMNWYQPLGGHSKADYHRLWPEPEGWTGFYLFVDTGKHPDD